MRTSAMGMGELLSISWSLLGISRRRGIERALRTRGSSFGVRWLGMC